MPDESRPIGTQDLAPAETMGKDGTMAGNGEATTTLRIPVFAELNEPLSPKDAAVERGALQRAKAAQKLGEARQLLRERTQEMLSLCRRAAPAGACELALTARRAQTLDAARTIQRAAEQVRATLKDAHRIERRTQAADDAR